MFFRFKGRFVASIYSKDYRTWVFMLGPSWKPQQYRVMKRTFRVTWGYGLGMYPLEPYHPLEVQENELFFSASCVVVLAP